MHKPSGGGRKTAGAPSRQWPLWLAVIVNVLVALTVVSLVQAFLVRVHSVSSGSMENTLEVTDRVASSPVPYLFGEPARGDIVIFGHGDTWHDARRPPETDPLRAAGRLFGDITGIGPSNTQYTVKRIIGLPGDVVTCCDAEGRVVVNGEPLDEPYIHQDFPFTDGGLDCDSHHRSVRCFDPVVVPDDRYLVLGDHRSRSADSVADCREAKPDSDCAVFARAEHITGKVIAKAWPPGPVG